MIPVVIGAAYGDEGKGATVNTLASDQSIVVRFNGGAQAGHTVIHNGHRRVFSHIGSGALKGAATYLSRYFVCHPLAFLAEWYDLLATCGFTPRVLVSPACPVTTLYDVMINRMLEDSRGVRRHGSVGAGFGETLERCQSVPFGLAVADLETQGQHLELQLRAIRDEWVPKRCAQLGLNLADCPQHFLHDDTIIEQMAADFRCFMSHVQVASDHYLAENAERLIFEGAQGLMLDQDRGVFPYVTRSNTGTQNVQKLLPGVPLDVFYVTRAYTTRHGAGPFPHELKHLPYPTIRDDTNITHAYQGSLRFSYLNLDTIQRTIGQDKATLPEGSRAALHMTCIDQLEADAVAIYEGSPKPCPAAGLPRWAAKVCGCRMLY